MACLAFSFVLALVFCPETRGLSIEAVDDQWKAESERFQKVGKRIFRSHAANQQERERFTGPVDKVEIPQGCTNHSAVGGVFHEPAKVVSRAGHTEPASV